MEKVLVSLMKIQTSLSAVATRVEGRLMTRFTSNVKMEIVLTIYQDFISHIVFLFNANIKIQKVARISLVSVKKTFKHNSTETICIPVHVLCCKTRTLGNQELKMIEIS